MKKIIFTEEFCQPENLFPFTLTRQIQDIRVGILTIREKWERLMGMDSFDKKEDDYKDLSRSIHLDEIGSKDTCYLLHGNMLPSDSLVTAIKELKSGECIVTPQGDSIAFCFSKREVKGRHKIQVSKTITYSNAVDTIRFPWEIIQLNANAIASDFKLLTKGRRSASVSKTNKLINAKQIFIEKGASIEHAIINATDGPVYIGKKAIIMEGSLIRGPFALGEESCLKMGTKIYGATSTGPKCVLGGEIKNSVIQGYSNKAHDGYLGDAVVGEWCNFGAGTSNSNIKNTAGVVKIWTPNGQKEVGVKCGVMVGDYTRIAINTSINTGSVYGVSANIFGTGLAPAYIPSFSWGTDGLTRYRFKKALEDIRNWKSLKGEELSEEESFILQTVYKKY
jgi:UDP-N-acetylglucosamine diphosphorylase/glucosamine-1-phosphate N-acetyltransferase